MKKDNFEFKQFKIFHDKCAMKVGTDGVLLGAWTQVGKEIHRILDVGCGSGVIAIMLAQKCDAEIHGIDIDKEAAEQANENAALTPWISRLGFYHSDVCSYQPTEKFDMIVCNPPFFMNSLSSPDSKRQKARHADSLPFDILCNKVAEWLENEGLFNIVIPTEVSDKFIQLCWENGLNLHRRCMVCTLDGGMPKRTLLSFIKGDTIYPVTEYISIRNGEGEYTDEYRDLTKEYYLQF